MTIQTATDEARLEADDHAVLWLLDVGRVRYQLAVALKGGWRIADISPTEQALLEAHGFGRGRASVRHRDEAARVHPEAARSESGPPRG